MHALDAELAAGSGGALAPLFSADGLDELLGGFVPRLGRRLSSAAGEHLVVRTTDTGHAFSLAIGATGTTTEGAGAVGEEVIADAPVDAALAGAAADLYRWGWARGGREGLVLTGDAAVVEHFEEAVHIRW